MKRTLISASLIVAVVMTATLLLKAGRTPSFKAVQMSFQSSDRALLDRNAQVIDEVRVEKNIRRLNWVVIGEVSPAFKKALIRAEDKRFFWHFGLDPLAIMNAVTARLMGGGVRGASTITMQLSELIESGGRSTFKRRSFWQKLNQAYKAVAIEIAWSKLEILEAYINLVQYRSELQGLSAASYGLFDKSPNALTRVESAVLVSLIRAPNARISSVKKRACHLLEKMGAGFDCGLLTTEHLMLVEKGYQIRPFIRMAPFIAKKIASNPEANKVAGILKSTLDRQVQWHAMRSLQRQIHSMQQQNMSDGAVVVIENSTGNILAYVGNIGKLSKASFVDAASAPRQAGSTLKPLVYAKAIDERILTAATILEDSPLAISVATGLYKPTNFDKSYRDMVTVRSALASSLNIPVVRALELIGVETFVNSLVQMGFTGLQRADFYGPSLALGSADVKLIELTNAYRTLANKGMWSPVRFSPDVLSTEASRRVFSEDAAYIVTDIIADREARAATFGLNNTLSTSFFSAVKTGTSQDMRDNWCIGFSEKYTVGVWAGNLNGEPMWNITGVHGAAPVWNEVMRYLHEKEPSRTPQAPSGLTQKTIYFTHLKQNRVEWFIKGTEPSTDSVTTKEDTHSSISYPINKSLVAIDPDIPRKNHRMFIQVVSPQVDQNLYLNGKRLGRAEKMLAWEPEPGKFVLELRDSRGQVVDKVEFEVRGPRFAKRGN